MKMIQFATAWTTESITKTDLTQVLVYMWRQPGAMFAYHHCVTSGLNPVQCEFSLKWDLDKTEKYDEYFNQCKINGSDTRVDIEKVLKKVMDSELLPVGWES